MNLSACFLLKLKRYFAFILIIFFSCSAITAENHVKVESVDGLHILEFITPEGKIYLNLPEDLRKGEFISGKLTLRPSGTVGKQIKKNFSSLKKYSLKSVAMSSKTKEKWGKWKVPDTSLMKFELRNSRGSAIAFAEIPVNTSKESSPPSGYRCDKVFIAGGFFNVKGKFDGDFSNTGIEINKKSLEKFAESERKVVVKCPSDMTGLTQIKIVEQNFTSQCLSRSLGLKTEIGKTVLLKDETTGLRISVSGLSGISEKISLQLKNKTPQILTLRGDKIITILPKDIGEGGFFSTDRTLKGIIPGKFHIVVKLLTEGDCKKILKLYNDLKSQFDISDKNCRDLAELVKKLRKKRDEAKSNRDKAKKNLKDTEKSIDKAKDDLKKAKEKLKKLINFAIHSDEISTEPKPGLNNSIGLYKGEVRIYFSGSRTSIGIVSWFLRDYRQKWRKLRQDCRDAAEKIKNLNRKKSKQKNDLKKAEQKLKDADKKLKEAEKKLEECMKERNALENRLKKLGLQYKKCLKRLEDQRNCEQNIKNARSSENSADNAIGDAESGIKKAVKDAAELKNSSQKDNDSLNEAKKLLKEAEELNQKAKQARNDAEKAYNSGDLETANNLASKADKLAKKAEAKANEAKLKASEAQTEIDKIKDAEREKEAERKRIERQRRELEKREKEWWDRFLDETDPSPHDISGGKKSLSIGLSELLDKHIADLIIKNKFGTGCKDKCLIAVRNIFGSQWGELLKDIAWDVFLGTLTLPVQAATTTQKIAFGVFKAIVKKLINSNHVIPLWGRYTYEHPVGVFKHMSVGKFKCEIESSLVYNKETGYVMGFVKCNCCGSVKTLYVKYKCDENGRALKHPYPRIEFR